MERYKREKLKEMSVSINTVQDAQEAISKCVMYIMKKKNMNAAACMNIIGDGIVTGLGSVEELFPNFENKEQLNATAKVIAARLSRYIMSFAKTR
jgi:hypothetical protein